VLEPFAFGFAAAANTSTKSETAYSTTNNHIRNEWVIDSGASNHICNDRRMFIKYQEISDIQAIQGFQGAAITSQGRRIVRILCKMNDKPQRIQLHNVSYIPGAMTNLISAQRLFATKSTVDFTETDWTIRMNSRTITGTAFHGIYLLDR
jgi:hypothetical protein